VPHRAPGRRAVSLRTSAPPADYEAVLAATANQRLSVPRRLRKAADFELRERCRRQASGAAPHTTKTRVAAINRYLPGTHTQRVSTKSREPARTLPTYMQQPNPRSPSVGIMRSGHPNQALACSCARRHRKENDILTSRRRRVRLNGHPVRQRVEKNSYQPAGCRRVRSLRRGRASLPQLRAGPRTAADRRLGHGPTRMSLHRPPAISRRQSRTQAGLAPTHRGVKPIRARLSDTARTVACVNPVNPARHPVHTTPRSGIVPSANGVSAVSPVGRQKLRQQTTQLDQTRSAVTLTSEPGAAHLPSA